MTDIGKRTKNDPDLYCNKKHGNSTKTRFSNCCMNDNREKQSLHSCMRHSVLSIIKIFQMVTEIYAINEVKI